jgi:hypothetical protein
MKKLDNLRNYVRFTENISNDSNSLYSLTNNPHSNFSTYHDLDIPKTEAKKLNIQ